MGKNRLITTVVAASLGLACSLALTQQQPNDPNAAKDAQQGQGQQVQTGAMPGGAMVVTLGPGGGGGMGGFRMGGPMFGADALGPIIMTLGELNLAPDFNLSAEQKQKIQGIRDEFKSAMESWRKDHAEDLKQLDDAQKELEENLRNGNPPDPQQMMEQGEQRRVLMETAPNGEDQATAVKGALTDDQRQRLDARLAEQEKQRQEMMQRMPFRFGPGGAMRNTMSPQQPDKDADKDKKDKGK